MKSVLRSIKPYWLYLILIGNKTVEVGKDCPKSNDWNRVVELYCSKDKKSFNRIPEKDKAWMQKYLGKVVCRFACDKIDTYTAEFVDDNCYEDIRYHYVDCEDEEHELIVASNWQDNPSDCALCEESCLTFGKLKHYIGVCFHDKPFYAWHISDLLIYDEPKGLGEFKKINRECWYADLGLAKRDCPECQHKKCFISRPPQSWCYVEGQA